jgi:uncharacterized protein
MLETIEKLLLLQDRDQKIRRVQGELAHLGPERESLRAKAAATLSQLETLKTRAKQLESDRKRLELDVESKKQQIDKYANQQLQTRKNEEYRALTHEIDACKADITKIEDEEIGLMEQAEQVQKETSRLSREAGETKKLVEDQVAQLDQREGNLKKELTELLQGRAELAAGVEESARVRYDRLVRSKGENVVVGVHHSVCGGCHTKLPPQILVFCMAGQEIITCTNCGRILYYTRDMAPAAPE